MSKASVMFHRCGMIGYGSLDDGRLETEEQKWASERCMLMWRRDFKRRSLCAQPFVLETVMWHDQVHSDRHYNCLYLFPASIFIRTQFRLVSFSWTSNTSFFSFIQLHFLNCPKGSKDKNDIRKLFDCATLVNVQFLARAFSSIVVMLHCDWLDIFWKMAPQICLIVLQCQ